MLSIRPLAKPDESLTSWLMRTCAANNISVKDLFSSISTHYVKTDIRKLHQIDLNPIRVLDLTKTSTILKKDEQYLKNLTFHEVLMKFHDIGDLFFIDKSSTFFYGLINIKYRRFCTSCLKNDIYYKLVWQIEDIKYCPIHNIELTNICTSCNKIQPYFHDNLLHGRCNYCEGSLTSIDTKYHKENLDTSTWLNKQWDFLLDPAYSISIPTIHLYENQRFNHKQSLLILFLFICGHFNPVFDFKKINYLSRDYKYKLLNSILKETPQLGSLDVSLKAILNILKKMNLDFFTFSKLNLPTGYIESLIKYFNKDFQRKCLAPWCSAFKKSTTLVKVKNIYSKTHYDIYSCTHCSLKFGFERNTKIWAEYGDFIGLGYKKALPLINKGNSKVYISDKLCISRYKVTKLISYFAQHNQIAENLLSKFLPKKPLKGRTIDLFIPFFENTESGTIQKVMKEYKWSKSEAYFHYYDTDVQQVINSLNNNH